MARCAVLLVLLVCCALQLACAARLEPGEQLGEGAHTHMAHAD
jgi:hypothetical protein